MMEKKNYIVINDIKYYPVYTKNALTCFNCSLYEGIYDKCKLSNTGIKCGEDYIFTR